MGFENLPPLAISSTPFQFLKSLDLKSVGLGLESVLHFGWDLVEWNPKFDGSRVDLGVKVDEFVEICDELEEDHAEVFGPQIELDLGTGSDPVHDLEEKPVEIVGEIHAIVDIGDETSEGKIDLELGTGDMPVHMVEGGDTFVEDYPGDSG